MASNTSFIQADLANQIHGHAIITLLNSYAEDEMGGATPLSQHVRNHLVQELAARDYAHAILGFVEEAPAALAICFEGFSTFACRPLLNIHDLTVHPDFRGRGLAGQLLAEVESLANSLHCCKITLEVLEGNHRAQHVYQQFGFNSYELDPSTGRALFFEKKL